MRTFLVLVLGLTLLLPACGSGDDAGGGTTEPSKTGDASPEPEEDVCPTVTATWRGEGNLLEFSAWEMSCGGCESAVQKRIRALEGVTEVEADRESSVVKVTLEDGVDRDKLASEITKALEEPESGKKFEIIRPTQ